MAKIMLIFVLVAKPKRLAITDRRYIISVTAFHLYIIYAFTWRASDERPYNMTVVLRH